MDQPNNQLYCRLREHLDRMPVGFPATGDGVEIRILERLFTPEDAELTLELSALPEPVTTIQKRVQSRLTAEDLQTRLDQMAARGLIHRLPSPKGPTYCKMIFAVGFYERQLKRLTPELARDCQEYLEGPFARATATTGTTQMRTVVVNKAIPVERNIADYEDLRAYVAAHPGPFTTMDCICRHSRELLGDPCKQTKLKESCLTFGVAARSMASSGMGRAISREEMLALIDAADREGLVLQPENTKTPLFVCCCCGCCCGVLQGAKKFDRPADYFSNTFQAAIEVEKCEACGVCQTRCQMEALVNESSDGKPRVDEARCIGCGLCVTTCPSDALRMVANQRKKTPPDDTRGLYVRLLEERYGKLRLAKMLAGHAVGVKF